MGEALVIEQGLVFLIPILHPGLQSRKEYDESCKKINCFELDAVRTWRVFQEADWGPRIFCKPSFVKG